MQQGGVFSSQVVIELGYGGGLLAQKELGWDRNTIRKGIKELTSGITCVDNYSAKGRYKAEEHLPNLLEDIKKLMDSQSQTDPSFKALNFAQNMTWKGQHPVVKLVTQTYEKGVKLTKKAMDAIEQKIERLTKSTHEKFPNLGKWFIDICCGVT